MPRAPRDDAPGVVHHVMVRGIERRRIFRDDRDCRELVRRLSVLMPELGFRCFGWVLMPNHFHLLARSGEARISQLMARLGTGYARWFNDRHDRVGHLFQNRFRSRRATDDADLLGLVRYVCRNPVEGGLVPSAAALGSYPWCSVGALLGRRAPYPFEAVGETLGLFDPDPGRARRRLRDWLAMPCDDAVTPRAAEPAGELRAHAEGFASSGDDGRAGLESVMTQACARFSISRQELCTWRRRNARVAAARAWVAVRACHELGLSGARIGEALGVTPSGVTRMLIRAGRDAGARSNESTSQ